MLPLGQNWTWAKKEKKDRKSPPDSKGDRGLTYYLRLGTGLKKNAAPERPLVGSSNFKLVQDTCQENPQRPCRSEINPHPGIPQNTFLGRRILCICFSWKVACPSTSASGGFSMELEEGAPEVVERSDKWLKCEPYGTDPSGHIVQGELRPGSILPHKGILEPSFSWCYSDKCSPPLANTADREPYITPQPCACQCDGWSESTREKVSSGDTPCLSSTRTEMEFQRWSSTPCMNSPTYALGCTINILWGVEVYE